MRLAGLLRAHGRQPGGNHGVEVRQLLEEIRDARRQQAALEALVEDDAVAQLDHRALEGRAHRRLDGLGELRLARQLRQALGHLEVGEALLAHTRAVVGREVEEREHVGMDDLEGGVGVGHLGLVEHVEQPLGGARGPALGRGDALAALQHEERGAGHGVERLDAPVDEGREPAEGGEVVLALIAGREQRGHDGQGGEEEDGEREKAFHGREQGRSVQAAARRLVKKPARWMPNWSRSPSVITPHAMYGMSQLGLRTTWRTVVVSLFSKPAW